VPREWMLQDCVLRRASVMTARRLDASTNDLPKWGLTAVSLHHHGHASTDTGEGWGAVDRRFIRRRNMRINQHMLNIQHVERGVKGRVCVLA
jgi:hypothetical protein